MTKISKTVSIPSVTIDNLSDYIELIEDITNKNPRKTIIYRGQPQDFDLLPSIARKNNKTDTTIKEIRILEEFKRRSRLKINTDFIDDWDWLIFAQHYGLKTRLLDWSSNPLVGLWFSCNEQNNLGEDGVIYIFKAKRSHLLNRKTDTKPFERNTTRVYKPHLNNERIIAQSGWFTAHGYSSTADMFVRLNHNTLLREYLEKVIIPSRIKERIIEKLDVLGINYERLFPDIDGICKQMNYENKL